MYSLTSPNYEKFSYDYMTPQFGSMCNDKDNVRAKTETCTTTARRAKRSRIEVTGSGEKNICRD